jgi:crotonobetainyl-CoA:carnitine CoA-transferase CaiB-like acyl-CoA transferase
LYSPHFQTYNRNKRSLVVDTRQTNDLKIFDELLATADVYIQNFRPGAAERLNVGEARLRKINPKLVYCSITGFGPDGPGARRPSYDTVAQAASGFLNLVVNPADPRVTGPAIADSITGFYAAYGILGALLQKERTGQGSLVEVSMLEAMTHFNLDAFTHFYSEGEVMGPFSRPRVSQSYVMRCADDKWIALHMSSPEKFWKGLAEAIEQPDIFEQPEFATREARIENQEKMIALLRDRFRMHSRTEWSRRLEEKDVPYSPMYDTSEALEDPQARHLDILVSTQHPTLGLFRTVRSPVTFDSKRSLDVIAPPLLDQDREEILKELAERRDARNESVPATDNGAHAGKKR